MLKRIKSAISKPSVTGKVPALVTLEGTGYHDRRIVGVPVHNLFAVASDGEKVRVFSSYSHESGKAVRVFTKHENEKVHPIMGLEHIYDDILASVDAKGILYTWKATNGSALERIKIQPPRISENNFKISCMTKINSSTLVIGTETGQLIIVTHENGKKLRIHQRLENEKIDCIYNMKSYGSLLVALTRSNDIYIFQYSTEDRLASYKHLRSPVTRGCVAISDRYIVTGHENGYIYVRRTIGDFAIELSINLNSVISIQNTQVSIVALTFVHSDLIIASSERHGIFFLSLTSVECVSHIMPSLGDNARLTTATILGGEGGCIAVGSNGKCGVFRAPQRVEDDVIACGEVLYEPILSVLPFFAPFQGAWHAMKQEKITLTEALTVASNPKYNAQTLPEWTHAHYLLMTAVRRGEIINESAKINKRNEVNWWCNLYYPVTSLEMGPHDVRFVQRFIREAEAAGVIDVSNANSFKVTDLRNVNIKDGSVLTSTFVELFARQVITYARVREILNYKKFQMGMELVYALVHCMPGPIVGKGVARLLSDRHSVLGDGFLLGDLMEFFFSVGKKSWTSFISELAVERFVAASTIILGDVFWNRVPKTHRSKVEDALEKLQITRAVLHEQFENFTVGLETPESRIASKDKPPAPPVTEVEKSETESRKGSRNRVIRRPSQIISQTHNNSEATMDPVRNENIVRKDTLDLLGKNISFEIVDAVSAASLIADSRKECSKSSSEESVRISSLATDLELQKSELDVLKLELEESRHQNSLTKAEMERVTADLEGYRKEAHNLRQAIEAEQKSRKEEFERNERFRKDTNEIMLGLKAKIKEILLEIGLENDSSRTNMSVRSDRSAPGGLWRRR